MIGTASSKLQAHVGTAKAKQVKISIKREVFFGQHRGESPARRFSLVTPGMKQRQLHDNSY
jgi:hypothetical protein